MTNAIALMDRLLDDFWAPSTAHAGAPDWHPPFEVSEAEDHFLVTLETPGIPRDQLKIEVTGNRLVVSGERRDRRFQRSFGLPPGTSSDKVEAKYQDGLLELKVPKPESAVPRLIKIAE